MSLALAESGPELPPALPRGAVPALLGVALCLHLALVALAFRSPVRDGAVAEGAGGLTVGLGPSGTAPGPLDPVAPRRTDAVPPAASQATQKPREPDEAAPSPAAVSAPASSAPEARAAPVTGSGPPVIESVAPPVVQSLDIAPPWQAEAPVTSPTEPEVQAAAEVPPDAATPASAPGPAVAPARSEPSDAPPELVRAAGPQQGLGVSRRPVERPDSVAEAGRAATQDAPRAEPPAPGRSAAAGRQGQGGTSQGTTRGGGDGTRGGGSPGARADFAQRVAARLARAKQYPRAAQARRLEGTGVVWFRIDAAGRVTASRLSRRTGHATLDQAIMRTLRRARLPAIPDSLGVSRMEFSVPIAFSLR